MLTRVRGRNGGPWLHLLITDRYLRVLPLVRSSAGSYGIHVLPGTPCSKGLGSQRSFLKYFESV